jgi:SNF2 family DNA or RNA helicase
LSGNFVRNVSISFYHFLSPPTFSLALSLFLFLSLSQIYILRETDIRSRLKKLRAWYNKGGVLMIGYEMYRNLAVAKKIRKKAYREELAKYLLDPGPDIMVCDEGHVMRNSKSNLSIVLGRVRTLTRIILTGTPLQNNLLECKMCLVHGGVYVCGGE